MNITCPHPRCNSKARWYAKFGERNWYQCLGCGFTFTDDQRRKKKGESRR